MASTVQGPALLHVGERKRGDKNFHTDEYVLAPPGTIVAPRRRGEPATAENALKALSRQAQSGGTMATGPSAFQSYSKAKNMAAPKPVGPPVYRQMVKAQMGATVSSAQPTAGMAVNPVADALTAIQSVANAQGSTPEMAANSLLNPGTTMGAAPPAANVPFATGGDAMSGFLQALLGGGQLTGPDLMLAQLALMQALGRIDPRALGVTDPAQFRALIAEGMGEPTLDMQRQRFNQSLFGFSQAAPSRGSVPTVASS